MLLGGRRSSHEQQTGRDDDNEPKVLSETEGARTHFLTVRIYTYIFKPPLELSGLLLPPPHAARRGDGSDVQTAGYGVIMAAGGGGRNIRSGFFKARRFCSKKETEFLYSARIVFQCITPNSTPTD